MNNCILYSSSLKSEGEFAEDRQTEWRHKWPYKRMYYKVMNKSNSISEKDMKKATNLSFTTWELEIDLKLHPTSDTELAQFRIEFSDTDPYFINKPSVLAYAYFPGQGEISGKVIFNDNMIWTLDGKAIKVKDAIEKGYPVKGNPDPENWLKTYNIINVLTHELGHSLGLRHDVTGNQIGKDVMDAYYSGDRRNLSERDIYRIRLKYPIRVFSKWSRYDRFKKWLAKKKLSF